MKPLNWIFLFILMNMFIMLVNIINYFNKKNKFNSKKNIKLNNKINWLW